MVLPCIATLGHASTVLGHEGKAQALALVSALHVGRSSKFYRAMSPHRSLVGRATPPSNAAERVCARERVGSYCVYGMMCTWAEAMS